MPGNTPIENGKIEFVDSGQINEKNRQRSEKSSNVGFVTLTSVSSNTFIDDLVRLSQIRQELQNSFLTKNFF